MKTEVLCRHYVTSFCLMCLITVATSVPQPANAQTATGSVTGVVTDPSGLPITDADVVLRNTDTNTEARYLTNDVGVYVAPYVQPGNYQITTKKEGFAEVRHDRVVVHVGESLTVNVRMPVRGETTSVTVTEEAPVLETDKTAQAQTVTQNQVEELPIASALGKLCATDTGGDDRRQ